MRTPKQGVPHSFLLETAYLHGLDLAGILNVCEARSQLEKAVPYLEKWQNDGFSGEMEYMRRGRELFSGLSHILPGARSVLLFLVPYAAKTSSAPAPAAGYGRVARYAWGKDYHGVLREKLKSFLCSLQDKIGTCEARVFTDSVPLLERTLGQRAGLGFIGKNSLLIRPGIGSFTFLAEVIWDIEVECDISGGEFLPYPGSGCGSCERCLTACPTGAFEGPGRLDSRRCISYLTIEKRTAFNDEEAAAIGSWVFGCDVCQEVCPFNHENTQGKVPQEFCADSGTGAQLSLSTLLNLASNEEFRARFSGTALLRARREGLVRNACAVAANTKFEQALGALRRLAAEDPAETVRIEARRSIRLLSGGAGAHTAVSQDFVENPASAVVI